MNIDDQIVTVTAGYSSSCYRLPNRHKQLRYGYLSYRK